MQGIRNLRIGQSDMAAVRGVMAEYRSALLTPESPCNSRCAFTFRIDIAFWERMAGHGAWLDSLAQHILNLTDTSVFARMGMRNFVLTATVTVAGERVASTTVSLLVEGDCHKWLGAGWLVSAKIPDFPLHPRVAKNSDSAVDLKIEWSHLHMDFETGEVLTAIMTPRATPEEQAAAFTINTHCMTSSVGCFYLSDIMPIAAQWQKSLGDWPLGWTSQTCVNHAGPD